MPITSPTLSEVKFEYKGDVPLVRGAEPHNVSKGHLTEDAAHPVVWAATAEHTAAAAKKKGKAA
jgi:hypothetical protein